MKKILTIAFVCGIVWITACGETAAPESESGLLRADNSAQGGDSNALTLLQPTAEGDVLPRVTITPPPVSEPEAGDSASYPAPVPPSSNPPPEGYALITPPPTIDPYPGPVLETLPQPEVAFAPLPPEVKTVWVEISAGVQCDSFAPAYEDILAAIEPLTAESIPVFDGVTESRAVCAACGCPDSVFYRLNINVDNLEAAVLLGYAATTP